MTGEVVDEPARSRLVLRGEGDAEAELVYEREDGVLRLVHTEVPDAFRGQGTGGHLVAAAVALARDEDLTIVPWCPFARRWLDEHPDAATGVTVDRDSVPPEPAA